MALMPVRSRGPSITHRCSTSFHERRRPRDVRGRRAPVFEPVESQLIGRRRRTRLELVRDPSPAAVAADPVRMQQIVSNLLVNAIKFTPSGGIVEVRLERREAEVRIVVHDSGAGIRSEFLPYIFDRFRQDDATKARSHGGLGRRSP